MRFPATPLMLWALFWWVLTGGDPGSWTIAIPTLAAAAAARRLLSPEPGPSLSLAGALGFAAAFLIASFASGLDVARRALRPRMALKPGFIVYPLRLETRRERVLMAAAISLLPGTLAAGLSGEGLTVHVLDTDADNAGELRRMEARVARVFRRPGGGGGPRG